MAILLLRHKNHKVTGSIRSLLVSGFGTESLKFTHARYLYLGKPTITFFHIWHRPTLKTSTHLLKKKKIILKSPVLPFRYYLCMLLLHMLLQV